MLIAVDVITAVPVIVIINFFDSCDCDVGTRTNSFDHKFDSTCQVVSSIFRTDVISMSSLVLQALVR